MKCSTCDDNRMIPSDDSNGDVMNTPCPECNEHSKSYEKVLYDAAWLTPETEAVMRAQGVPGDLDAWIVRPEAVLRHFRKGNIDADGVTAREINRRRWGSYVDVRVDIEALKACARKGLVRCVKGRWFIQRHGQILP